MSWFFVKHGITTGPISLMDLSELICLNKLACSDLLSFEMSPWKYAYQYPQVSKLFGEKFSRSSAQNTSWVVMKFINGELQRRLQLGPWSASDVRLAIQTGEVSYQDYVWRRGMLQWYPLVMLPEFNAPKKINYFSASVSPKNSFCTNKPAKPYMIMSPRNRQSYRQKPPEDELGVDLVPPVFNFD